MDSKRFQGKSDSKILCIGVFQLDLILEILLGSGQEETNVYDIVKLGADSLVFKDAEDTYEYSRQRAKKNLEDEIKLEDTNTEDFRI